MDGEREWDIWRDGCEGGEGPEGVMERLDGLIARIREMQGPWIHGGERGADVLLVCMNLCVSFDSMYQSNFTSQAVCLFG